MSRHARLTPCALTIALCLLGSPRARASGFAVTEQSASALARAGAVSAAIDDASAVYHNPALMPFGPSRSATASLGVITARTRFSPTDAGPDVASKRQVRPVPSLFAQARVHDRIDLGLGLFAPFGFAVSWPEGWVGAQQSLVSFVRIVAANPVVAVKLHDEFSAAVGVSVLHGDVELGLALPALAGGRADLDASSWGWAWNAALLWRPIPERLQVAFSYRSGAELDLEGDADFQTTPAFAGTFPDGPARATLPLPSIATLGIAGRPVATLTVSADVTWTNWSVFDELLIDLDSFDPLIQRDSRDAFAVAVGGAYQLSPYPVTIRTGARFEQSVSRKGDLSPSTPDADRLGLGLGVGWRGDPVGVDLGYLYTHFLDADATNPGAGPQGTYSTRLHAFALTVTLR